jgi:hypothetical protein
MAVVGAGATVGDLSYIAVGREITYGTMVTCTAGLNFLSASIVAKKDFKILEEIQTSRTNSNGISLGKTVEGDIETYFSPLSLAHNYLLHNAFGGGPVSTVTATGETVGGGALTHTVSIGNFDTTYASLSINMRKGDSTGGKVFEYSGIRVNEMALSAEMDEALKATFSIIAKDVTSTSNDVSSALSTINQFPLSFVNGRLSVESSTASITSSVFWHVQSVNFKISNNLNADARRIGSDVISVLPAGLAQFELSCSMRFDTTTAWSAMMAGSRLVAEFEFQGDTISGSVARQGIRLLFPYVVVSDAGDPEIGGPNEVLSSEVTFAVLRDPTSAGYAVKAFVTNTTTAAAYA